MRHLVLSATMALALAGILILAGAAPPQGLELQHFALSKSAPEADATVEAPSEVRLWFTQEPQEGTTSIRIVEAEEVEVHVTEAAQDTDEPTSFFVQLHGMLPAGTYTVSWRGMGQDGHVVRDTFEFTVDAR